MQWRVEIWWRLARGPGFGMGSLGLAQCERHALAAPVQRPGRGHQFFQCANRGTARLPVYQWHFSGGWRPILENRQFVCAENKDSIGMPQTISLNSQRWGGFLQ